MHFEQTPEEMEALARKLLLYSRRRLTHISPVLLESVYAMPDKVRPTPGPLSTDGRFLWFDPQRVLNDFRKDHDAVARQILHITAHCLLGHLELRPTFPNAKSFDAAADLKAAQFAEAIYGLSFVDPKLEKGWGNSYKDFEHLRPLYESLSTGRRQRSPSLIKAARFDDHTLWTPPPAAQSCGTSSGQDGGPQAAGGSPNWDQIRQSMLNGRGGKLPGDAAGLLTENFAVPDRGMSYAHFLRRFAAPQERMLLDPDSFDVRWYHLGLEYYGDIPLLEPSELSEPPLPDDLVIALDTSGSCSGEVCKRFLKETLGILRDISGGASRFRVLFLQCDTEIQQELLLETPEQVEELFQSFTAHGFGGTDFRPVFQRVEERRRDGTLPRVRGLLYLSDGYGAFPDTPTDYPTAFLIPREDRGGYADQVGWITRLYLDQDSFTLKEANTP